VAIVRRQWIERFHRAVSLELVTLIGDGARMAFPPALPMLGCPSGAR
jgi:hypothetical protein